MPVFDVAYCLLVHQGPVNSDCPTPQRQIDVDLSVWSVGHLVQNKPFSMYSIECMSGEHAGHSSLAMLLSWRNSFTRCTRWGQELSSIKTNSFPKFCRYGCTICQRMSFLYRIAISAPSMSTSGVRRPHIMPPQNIREPPSCCTRWTVCLRRSAWPDCLRIRLWRLVEGTCDTHLWIELAANSDESIQQVLGPPVPLCIVSRCQMWTLLCTSGVKLRIVLPISYSLSRITTSCGCTISIIQHGGVVFRVPPSWNPQVAVINCSGNLWAAWATHVIDSSCIYVPPLVRTTSLWFIVRRLETSLDESPSWPNVTMRTWEKVAIDLLSMAELQKTREMYLLPNGMTGTDRLFHPSVK